jgi:hypothetical protein
MPGDLPEIVENRRVLAVLAGGQITPNMYAIRTFGPRLLIVFHSDQPDSHAHAERLRQLGAAGKVRAVLLPSPYSPKRIGEEVERALADVEPSELLWHATSGSKPMAVGAMLWAEARRVPVLYFEDGFEFLLPSGLPGFGLPERAWPSSVREQMSWQQGRFRVEVRPDRFDAPRTARLLGTHFPEFSEWLSTARSQLHPEVPARRRMDSRSRGVPEPLWGQLLAAARDEGLLADRQDGPWFTRPGGEFLRGFWLEQYVFDCARESGRFTDVVRSVSLCDEGNTELAELDVVALYRGNLVIVSCKTGTDVSTMAETNRLLAWRPYFGGQRARSVLVTARDVPRAASRELQAAGKFLLVGSRDLPHLPGVLSSEFTERPKPPGTDVETPPAALVRQPAEARAGQAPRQPAGARTAVESAAAGASRAVPALLRNRHTVMALAGGQSFPNIFVALALAPRRLALLHTSQDESREAALAAKRYLRGKMHVSLHSLSRATSWMELGRELDALCSSEGLNPNELVLHVTSGTKPMMQAALDLGRSRGVPVVYYESQRLRFLWPPDEEEWELPGETRPGSLEEYLLWSGKGFRTDRLPAGLLARRLRQALGQLGVDAVFEPAEVKDSRLRPLAKLDAGWFWKNRLHLVSTVDRPNLDRVERTLNQLLAWRDEMGGLRTRLALAMDLPRPMFSVEPLARLCEGTQGADLTFWFRPELDRLESSLESWLQPPGPAHRFLSVFDATVDTQLPGAKGWTLRSEQTNQPLRMPGRVVEATLARTLRRGVVLRVKCFDFKADQGAFVRPVD